MQAPFSRNWLIYAVLFLQALSPTAQASESIDSESIDLTIGHGIQLVNKLKFGEAKKEFLKVISVEPNNVKALAWLGLCELDEGKWLEAIAIFSKILEIDPHNVFAHNECGFCFQQMKMYSKAESEYRKAVALDPTTQGFHINLGSVLREMGELNEAEKEYLLAAKLDPSLQEPWLAISAIRKQMNRPEEAQAALSKAASLGRLPFSEDDWPVRVPKEPPQPEKQYHQPYDYVPLDRSLAQQNNSPTQALSRPRN